MCKRPETRRSPPTLSTSFSSISSARSATPEGWCSIMQMTTGGDHDVENAECVADRGLSRQVPRTVRSPSALRQVVPEELLRALRVSLAVTLQETAMAPNDTDIHR